MERDRLSDPGPVRRIRAVRAIAIIAIAGAAQAADLNPAHIAPNLSAGLSALTGAAQVRLVWVQKQLVSDDSTRFLDCGADYTSWMFNGGPGTKLVGFDSREGIGRILDSSQTEHVKPIIDRSGRYAIWNNITAGKSWITTWDGSVKKVLIDGGAFIVACTWYDRASGKEYVFAAEPNNPTEYLLGSKNIYRYELDLSNAAVVTGTKTIMWNKTPMHFPFTVAADGIHAASNLTWPDAHAAVIPNGALTRFNPPGQWACAVNISPDASLRYFHCEAAHRQIAMYGPTLNDRRWVPIVARLPGADSTGDCNGPRWTNDIRYLTVFSPYEYWGSKATRDCTKPVDAVPWREGESGEMYFGKFNSQFTDAQFLRVTDGDWRFRKVMGDAWVSTGEGPEAVTVEGRRVHRTSAAAKTDGPQRGRNRTELISIDGRTATPDLRSGGSEYSRSLTPGVYFGPAQGEPMPHWKVPIH